MVPVILILFSKMTLIDRISAFSSLGAIVSEYVDARRGRFCGLLDAAVQRAVVDNYWFTADGISAAMRAVANKMLDGDILRTWTARYTIPPQRPPKTIGLINAGNIPLVGFHDLLCVLIAGDRAQIKASSKDSAMIKAICEILVSIEPRFADAIAFIDQIPTAPEAVIATGSDNSARYFEAAYGHIPHIVRRNRYSLALLTGKESKDDLRLLGKDIFSYFGLGCRNVSCLLVPDGYAFDSLFSAIEGYGDVMLHEGYRNCYRYRKAALDLSGEDYVSNGFVLLTKNSLRPAWLASVNYLPCRNAEESAQFVHSQQDKIQCIVGRDAGLQDSVAGIAFGASQSPEIDDYADGVDTLEFLLNLSIRTVGRLDF